MDYSMRSVLLAFTIAIPSLLIDAKDSEIDRFAINGTTIRLHCDLQVSDDPDVEWVDLVHSSTQDPAKIFHSRNNPHFSVLDTHPNSANFHVGHDFTLTISNLNMDSDVGEYSCRSRIGGTHLHRRYYLTIGEHPKCSGKTNLRSGEQTSLSCQMGFSGKNPNLEWFEDDETIDSTDEYEIQLAKKVVQLDATHRYNGVDLQCRMSIGGVVHKCNLSLSVTYGVHHPKFHPVKETFEPGDEVKCTAKGNPTPNVTLGPDFPHSSEGLGWAALIVEESWVGQQIHIKCVAANVVDDVEHEKSRNFTFSVVAQRKHDHHHHHHQHPQQSTEPIVNATEEHVRHSPAEDQQMEKKIDKETPDVKPKPNVKSVKSNNSKGNLTTFSVLIAFLGVVAAVLV